MKRLHGTLPEEIGVAQGSAASNFLVNLVLHSADQAVAHAIGSDGDQIAYLRFCDDAIFVSTDRESCRRAMATYCAELDSMRLPFHPPVNAEVGTLEFTHAKSRPAYLWSETLPQAARWVEFLGHAIHATGPVRISGRSVARFRDKVAGHVDRVTRLLHQAVHAEGSANSREQNTTSPSLRMLYRRITGRILGRATGRHATACTGFHTLLGRRFFGATRGPALARQLRELDGFLEQQFRYLASVLRQLNGSALGRHKTSKQGAWTRYLGFPFRLSGQLFRFRNPD